MMTFKAYYLVLLLIARQRLSEQPLYNVPFPVFEHDNLNLDLLITSLSSLWDFRCFMEFSEAFSFLDLCSLIRFLLCSGSPGS